MRDKISACLTVYNEEKNIEQSLKSLSWVDEIVVVDSFSSDRTMEICRKYTDRVYQHEWLGYIGQKAWALDKAIYPWVFFLDGDEEVSPELREEIIAEFEEKNNKNYVGYEFPRKVFFLGAWIKYGDWWPDLKLRLFLKDKGKCVGPEPHDRVQVEGSVKQLSGCLYHYTYRDLSDQLNTLDKFSSISCKSMVDNGKRFFVYDICLRPLFRFCKTYVLKKGFMGGIRGLIISVMVSFSVFLKYAKLWECLHVSNDAAEKEDSFE